MSIQHPQKVYDFTAFSQSRPDQQQPGDRMDAQFQNHKDAIDALVEAFTSLQTRVIYASDLDPALLSSFTQQLALASASMINACLAHANDSQTFSNQSLLCMQAAQRALANTEIIASQIQGLAPSIMADLQTLNTATLTLYNQLQQSAPAVFNAKEDAEGASAVAEDWAQVSIAWAEYMPGTIPPNILAVAGVTGDHWSSRWWANQASQLVQDANNGLVAMQDLLDQAETARDAAIAAQHAAEAALDEFTDLYLGAGPANPSVDHDGDPLQPGALFFNTSSPGMYVWSGTQWNLITTTSGAPVTDAAHITVTPAGGISSTNVQSALQELDTEKVPLEPQDGGTYGRRNGVWVSVVSPSIDWGDITGKPTTFPPSAHTHPQSEVTGLTASLAAKANQTALDQTNQNVINEINDRTAADAQINSDLAAETLARQTNDAALQANINAKVGEAPNDGLQYVRKSQAWAAAQVGAVISLTAPSSPYAGMLWWDSDTGRMYVYYTDANSSQWVQVNAFPNIANFLRREGDTMTGPLVVPAGASGSQVPRVSEVVAKAGDTMTGDLVIDKTNPALFLEKVGGDAASIVGRTAGAANKRWEMFLGNAEVESGGNAGSNFALAAYSDAQVASYPIIINRNTGVMTANLAQPTVMAHRSGAGNVNLGTSLWTKINLGTLAVNVGGWALSGNSLLIPKTGTYVISASAAITTPALVTSVLVGFGINGSLSPNAQARAVQQVANAGTWVLNTMKAIPLVAGSTIELLGFSTAAGAQVIDPADSTFISATMVASS